jgi:membrane protein required for beta-lactamase induction
MGGIRALRVVVLAITCLIALGVILLILMTPEYSDDQIRESIVDIWESSVVVTFAILCVLGFFALLSVIAGSLARGAERLFAVAAVLLALGAGTLAYHSHATLTYRTTELTGQVFGPCSGLC